MGLNTVGAQLGLQQMMELMKKMKNSTHRVVLLKILITSASGNGLHVIMLEKQMHASYVDAMAVVRHGRHPDLFINAAHFGQYCTQREVKQPALKPTPSVLDDCLAKRRPQYSHLLKHILSYNAAYQMASSGVHRENIQ